MQLNRNLTILSAAASTLLCVAAGCGAHKSVEANGTVTCNNQPVKKGLITFTPADGRYVVANVTAGKKIVHIVGLKDADRRGPLTREHMAQEVAQRMNRGPGNSPNVVGGIPAGAEGNDVVVELHAGRQTLDFQLKLPHP